MIGHKCEHLVGEAVERYVYSLFGEPAFQTPDFGVRAASRVSWQNLYCACSCESATGLIQIRNRDYSIILGLWTRRDPALYVDGVNLYAYCSNNPATLTDSSGMLVDVIDQANKRRGHGPCKDSAQHCWLACYVGAMANVGGVAAVIGDLAEIISPSSDSLRDIAAQHVGGAVGDTFFLHSTNIKLACIPLLVSKFCDAACLTWP